MYEPMVESDSTDLAPFHGTLFGYYLRVVTAIVFWISKFFSLSITEEIYVIKMRIWCNGIGMI
jgi:hypothetical protein